MNDTIEPMQASEFEAMSAVEDRHWWFRGKRAIVTSLLQKAGVRGKVLDAGCGTGSNLPALEAFGEAVGIDKDPVAIEFARKRFHGKVVTGALTALPFSDNEFDGIITTDVMEHVPDDRAALRELARVLKPGGTLLLTVPAHPSMWTGHDVALGHVRRYTETGFRDLLAAAPELEAETVSYMNCAAFPLAAAQRWLRSRREKKSGSPVVVSDTAEVPPALVNETAARIFAAERHLLDRFQLPFGVSIIAVLRKKNHVEERGCPAPRNPLGTIPLVTAGIVLLLALVMISAPHLTGNWLAGHEGPSYLFRLAEYHAMLSQGELYPRWMPDFYWGYGYPLFNYYSPGLFAFGSVVMAAGFTAVQSLHFASVMSSVLFFLGSFRLASLWTRRTDAAFAGALVATLSIYRFVQFYVRADLAEAFATGFVPWALAEGIILSRDRNPRAFARLGLFLAATFYSHTITSVMTSGALGLLGLSCLFRRNPAGFVRVGTGSFLGVAIAAAYWVPAFFEQKYVSTDRMISNAFNGAEWHEHFVMLYQRLSTYFYYGDSVPGAGDRLSFATSYPAIAVLATAAVLAIANAEFRRKAWPLIAAAIAVNLMMFSATKPLWAVLPLIKYFQFPWRFLVLDAVLVAPVAAIVISELERRRPGKIWLAVLGFLVIAGAVLHFDALIVDTFRETFFGGKKQYATVGWHLPLLLAAVVAGTASAMLVVSVWLERWACVLIGAALLFTIPVSVSPLLRTIYNPMAIDSDLREVIEQPAGMQRYGLMLPSGKVIPVTTAAQDEYLPRTARVEQEKPPETPGRFLTGAGTALVVEQRGDLRRYAVKADVSSVAELSYFYFPGIQVDVDGSPREPGMSLAGLVTVNLEPGGYLVDIWYDGTRLQKSAEFLSLVGLAIMLLLYFSPALKRRMGASDGATGNG